MSRGHSPTTPADFIVAFCGTQTSETCPTARPRTYTPLAADLLLCSFGATPHANTSANYNGHAGAARWMQRATVPPHEVCEGGRNPRRRASLAAEESSTHGPGVFIFARRSSMTILRPRSPLGKKSVKRQSSLSSATNLPHMEARPSLTEEVSRAWTLTTPDNFIPALGRGEDLSGRA